MKNSGDNLTSQLTSALLSMTDEELKKVPHNLLYTARAHAPKADQNRLAASEHRAFAREVTAEDPLMAIPLLAGIPAYQVYKMLYGARSDPSIGQAVQGIAGIGDGLSQSLSNLFK